MGHGETRGQGLLRCQKARSVNTHNWAATHRGSKSAHSRGGGLWALRHKGGASVAPTAVLGYFLTAQARLAALAPNHDVLPPLTLQRAAQVSLKGRWSASNKKGLKELRGDETAAEGQTKHIRAPRNGSVRWAQPRFHRMDVRGVCRAPRSLDHVAS